MSGSVSEALPVVNVRGEYFHTTTSTELFDLICGDRVGNGIARVVYAHALDDTLVVKFEVAQARFQNIAEWQAWQELRGDRRFARWLAPCVAISPCGTVMLQKRVDPLRIEMAPKKVPVFFTDTKLENWGMLGGHPVCCDYGKNRLQKVGATTRMRAVHWSSD